MDLLPAVKTNKKKEVKVLQDKTALNIHQAIVAIIRDSKAIGKDNKARDFKFRGIDDVINGLHNVMAKHGVYYVAKEPELLSRKVRPTKSGGAQMFTVLKGTIVFYAEDGSSVETTHIAEGANIGDKSCAVANSVLTRTALITIFNVKTEDKLDPEYQHIELTDTKVMAPELAQITAAFREVNITETELITFLNKNGASVTSLDQITHQHKGILKGLYKESCELQKRKKKEASETVVVT